MYSETDFTQENKSERPVDALAVKKHQSLTDSLSDNFKSRDASASKNCSEHFPVFLA